MAKSYAHQIEIDFGEPEPIKLTIQTTQDGDRVTRETAQREADQQHAESQQIKIGENAIKFFAIVRPPVLGLFNTVKRYLTPRGGWTNDRAKARMFPTWAEADKANGRHKDLIEEV